MPEEASGRDGHVIRERRCEKLQDMREEEMRGEEKNGRRWLKEGECRRR